MERLQTLQPLLEECLPSLPSDIIGCILKFDYQPKLTVLCFGTIDFESSLLLVRFDEDLQRPYEWIHNSLLQQQYPDTTLIDLTPAQYYNIPQLTIRKTHKSDLNTVRSDPLVDASSRSLFCSLDSLRSVLDLFIEVEFYPGEHYPNDPNDVEYDIESYALIDFHDSNRRPTLVYFDKHLPCFISLCYNHAYRTLLNEQADYYRSIGNEQLAIHLIFLPSP